MTRTLYECYLKNLIFKIAFLEYSHIIPLYQEFFSPDKETNLKASPEGRVFPPIIQTIKIRNHTFKDD
jgi:hypothetical protein